MKGTKASSSYFPFLNIEKYAILHRDERNKSVIILFSPIHHKTFP